MSEKKDSMMHGEMGEFEFRDPANFMLKFIPSFPQSMGSTRS